jgi:hypothetical protein
MPDFEVNEGYVEAGRRRADSPLSARQAGGESSVDGRVAPPDGRGAVDERALGEEREASIRGEASIPGGELRRLPEQTPIVRRTRHLASGHLPAGDVTSRRCVGVALLARRRRLARRACPYGWRVRVLDQPRSRRRRLWTTCHGSR